MNKCSYLMVGLPGTGKTTFLAALWHVINSQGVAGSLVLSKFVGDREYVASACDNWLGCRKFERTTGIELKPITLNLCDRDKTSDYELFIPDIAGEEFDRIFEERKWPKELKEFAASADGIILFVHPQTVKEPVSILWMNRIMGTNNTEGEIPDELHPWAPSKASTQAKLVDILQFIADVRTRLPFRIVVIVSAWDLVEKLPVGSRPKTPHKWLAQRLPLLDQFLRCNEGMIESNIFGVSAQGGDLELDASKLLDERNPLNRIKIVTEESFVSNDLTLPIKSLLKPQG